MYKFIKDRKIKFALVGCGRIAKNHFDSIESHSDRAELVDICDINYQALKDAEKLTNAKPHENIKDLLNSSQADVIILTTPSGLHCNQAIMCAEANKHVITEKPMATSWSDGLRMVEECINNNVELFVVKQNRKNPTLQALKRSIDQGRFGKIYSVSINVFWTRPQEYYDSASWRGTWAMDGGALMNQASHYMDLLTWLFGPVDSISSFTATLARKIEAEDSAILNILWKSGALGTMNVSMLAFPKNFEGSIAVIGEKGTVKIGGVAVNKILHWEFFDRNLEDDEINKLNYEVNSVYGFGHPRYYQNVIDTLQGKASPETNGPEGLKSLELIIASYISAKENRLVNLPLLNNGKY
jgi:UDP-N-acetyl-2-amino-2-deoxyglucuronate dehydrogenase